MSIQTQKTDTNRDYKRWYLRNFAGLCGKMRDMEAQYKVERDAAIAAVIKNDPKLKKKKNPLLAEEQYAKITADLEPKWRPLANEVATALTDARKCRAVMLSELCEGVVAIPCDDFYIVRTSSTCTYRSQGYGAGSYAREDLRPREMHLQAHGLITHVDYFEHVPYAPGFGRGMFSGGHDSIGDYRLWVNCPPWMADAIIRRLTVEQALKYIPRVVNPAVLIPMLPQHYLDAHWAKKD